MLEIYGYRENPWYHGNQQTEEASLLVYNSDIRAVQPHVQISHSS